MSTELRRRSARPRRPWFVLGAGLAAACNGTTSYLDATGAAGGPEATLGIWLTVVASVVVVLVCAALLLGIWRHRDGRDAPPDRAARSATSTTPSDARRGAIRTGLRWIHIGLAATIVVLLGAYAGTMVTLQAASHPPVQPSLTLDVTGHQWWWEVRYSDVHDPSLGFVTANEVHLPVGQPVRVRLHSADVIHSFWIPQLAGKMDVIPGQVNEMWLEATRAGQSRGACAEYCGLQHAMMALAVTSESPDAFRAWAAAHRADAATPTDPDASAGRVVFARSCGACHAVKGTEALGRVGPDLTHVASRATIGAGALTNTPEHLREWITNAPNVKEGVRMPAIPLDEADLGAVVAYLATLR